MFDKGGLYSFLVSTCVMMFVMRTLSSTRRSSQDTSLPCSFLVCQHQMEMFPAFLRVFFCLFVHISDITLLSASPLNDADEGRSVARLLFACKFVVEFYDAH